MLQKLRFINYLLLPILYVAMLIFIAQYLSSIIQYTYNSTASEKLGYYLLYPASIKVGSVYQICLDTHKQEYVNIMIKIGLKPSGNCKNGYMSLLKTIAAGPGDVIQIDDSGVLVNNKLLPDSKGIKQYKNVNLKRLPVGLSYKLSTSEYWLYGYGQTSYDSRYFGVVTSSEIGKKATWVSF